VAYRDHDPSVLVFGDSSAGIAVASATALALGGRIAAALPIEQASDRLDSQIAVDLVIVDVAVDHGALLDRLFRQIEDAAASQRFASIVAIAPELVDLAAARIDHEDVSVVVGRDGRALRKAVANGLARIQPQLQDSSDEMGAMRLPDSEDEGGDGDPHSRLPLETDEDPADFSDVPLSVTAWADGARAFDPAVIRGIIRARRLRQQFFGAGLFADPAWDILLDLMVARIERRQVAVSSLCIAAAVPATTALRWIKQLTEMGLLHRVADPQDGRRVFIELTERAVDTLLAYFSALIRGRQG
jgi:hypothetical protein